MKVFLVARGSQGDVYPYLAVADTLTKQGHDITLSIPQVFEKEAKTLGLHYVLQNYDDISTLLEKSKNAKDLLTWVNRITAQQFEEFVPILQKHDVVVSTNTEFALPSIAEFCKKPFIRTAYAPLIPSPKIPPPLMPWPRPHPIVRPMMLWGMLNVGINLLTKKTINTNRKKLGLAPVKNLGHHAPGAAHNFLLYSPSLGSVDLDWPYRWDVGGYCFNDLLSYDKEAYSKLLEFINKDTKPVLFFTLGSCQTKQKDEMCALLLDICLKHDYRLVVGSGWWQVGANLAENSNMFLQDGFLPHGLIFPLFDAIVHHGGCGTSHSAARAGKPQLATPIFMDQHYWGTRIAELGIGPEYVALSKLSKQGLEKKVVDLMSSNSYKQNAQILMDAIAKENGIQALCDKIVSLGSKK